MPYTKMRLNYFELIERLLQSDVYIKITCLNNYPLIQVLKHTVDGEVIIMSSDINASLSRNLLDLIHEMSTRLNDGKFLFPQYKNIKMRGKTLDNVIALDYEIYFYKTIDGQILGKITKTYENEVYDIFIGVGNDMKESFEILDSSVYNRFGYYPDLREDNLSNYAEEIVRKRIDKSLL